MLVDVLNSHNHITQHNTAADEILFLSKLFNVEFKKKKNAPMDKYETNFILTEIIFKMSSLQNIPHLKGAF